MRKLLFYIALVLTSYLGFKMTEPYLCEDVQLQGYFVDSQDVQIETFLSAQSNEMVLPHLVNTITVPVVHFTTTRKIQKTSNISLIFKCFQAKTKFVGYKPSPQLLCCFSSPNDLFVVLFRRLII